MLTNSNSRRKPKVKSISFNMHNPIEAFMFKESENMEGSFSGLMKYLYLSFLANQGISPPGILLKSLPKLHSVTTDRWINSESPPDTKGILRASFVLNDDD